MEHEVFIVTISPELPRAEVLKIIESIQKVSGVTAVKTLDRVVFEMNEQ